MKTKLIFFILLIFFGVCSYLYFLLPPYYLNAYFSRYSNLEYYERIVKIVKDRKQGTYSLSIAGDLLVIGEGVALSSLEQKRLKELMRIVNIGSMKNAENSVTFYVGGGDRSELNYRVFLVKKKEGHEKSFNNCEDNLFQSSVGSCLFDLEQSWGIGYAWVTLP